MTDLISLMLTIYGEARGESIEGQIAVANVIKNRVKQSGKSYEEICHADRQFSCWNHDDPNYPILMHLAQNIDDNNPVLRQCQYIAEGIMTNKLLDNVHGVLNYMTASLFNSSKRPHWAMHIGKVIEKGNHVFFTA